MIGGNGNNNSIFGERGHQVGRFCSKAFPKFTLNQTANTCQAVEIPVFSQEPDLFKSSTKQKKREIDYSQKDFKDF